LTSRLVRAIVEEPPGGETCRSENDMELKKLTKMFTKSATTPPAEVRRNTSIGAAMIDLIDLYCRKEKVDFNAALNALLRVGLDDWAAKHGGTEFVNQMLSDVETAATAEPTPKADAPRVEELESPQPPAKADKPKATKTTPLPEDAQRAIETNTP